MSHEIRGHGATFSIRGNSSKEDRILTRELLKLYSPEDTFNILLSELGLSLLKALGTLQEVLYPSIGKLMRYNLRIADRTLMLTKLGRLAKNKDIEGLTNYYKSLGNKDSEIPDLVSSAINRMKYSSDINELATRANSGHIILEIDQLNSPKYTMDLAKLLDLYTPGSLKLFLSLVLRKGGRLIKRKSYN